MKKTEPNIINKKKLEIPLKIMDRMVVVMEMVLVKVMLDKLLYPNVLLDLV